MAQQTAAMMAGTRLKALEETGPGTGMGDLLRMFWQPVALSESIRPGAARALRVLCEDLTLYRSAEGNPHLVAGRCPHRRTLLHTGWVQGEELRCIYHGWKFDGAGRCTEAPAEGSETAARIKIAAYPLEEYCGLIFAYLGPGAPPPFDLPRKAAFERHGSLTIPRLQTWPCNWLQHVENSLDAVHVSFVHQAGKVGEFGKAVTAAIPRLEYLETEAGIRQIATRSATNVRVSDWTFPNNNHIVVPGLPGDPWIDVGIWMVPVDDYNTHRFILYSLPEDCSAQERFKKHFQTYSDYDPADHHDELFRSGIYPDEPILQLTGAQDYVATVGQGRLDRSQERLGKSDAGIVFLRRLFWRELDAAKENRAKIWRPLEHSAALPKPAEPG